MKTQKKSHSTLRQILKITKIVYFGEFLKSEACGQTVLPDRSVLIRQKLVENVKI